MAARIHHHLFRYPFGLAVSKIEKLHVLVHVGFVQDFLNRPAKHKSCGDVVETLGTSFKREPQDLIGPEHVRIPHPVVVEQVVYGCAVVEHGVDFFCEEIPDFRHQAEVWLAEIAANGNHARLEHLHQRGRAWPHGFHSGPQSLPALLFVRSPDQNMDLRVCLFQQALHQERPDEAGAACEQHLIQDRCLGHQRRRRRLKDELAIVTHHLLFRRSLLVTERSERIPQQNQSFFGQPEQLGHADTLNQADVHLPGQHIRAFVFQKLLDLVHEYDKVE